MGNFMNDQNYNFALKLFQNGGF